MTNYKPPSLATESLLSRPLPPPLNEWAPAISRYQRAKYPPTYAPQSPTAAGARLGRKRKLFQHMVAPFHRGLPHSSVGEGPPHIQTHLPNCLAANSWPGAARQLRVLVPQSRGSSHAIHTLDVRPFSRLRGPRALYSHM